MTIDIRPTNEDAQARGILPNIQDVPSSAPGTTRIFYARTRAAGPIKCNVGWEPLPLPVTGSEVPSTDQLLLDFFRFYGFQHDYRKDIVSVRLGGVVQRQKGIQLEGKRGRLPTPKWRHPKLQRRYPYSSPARQSLIPDGMCDCNIQAPTAQ